MKSVKVLHVFSVEKAVAMILTPLLSRILVSLTNSGNAYFLQHSQNN